MKKHLEDKGVKLVNFGVGPANKAAFDFAKEMGIETLVSEPKFNEFDDLDKLVEEYQINVAIHDHPRAVTLLGSQNRSQAREGPQQANRCAAAIRVTGYALASIQSRHLKILEGRIISFHLKDLTEFNSKNAHDVPWGTGRGEIKAILTEVKRQGLKPVFSIEYETKFTMPQLAQCVAYMDKVAAELANG